MGVIVADADSLCVEVGFGVTENVAVMGTSPPLRACSNNVAAMDVAARSLTESGGVLPGKLHESMARMIAENTTDDLFIFII